MADGDNDKAIDLDQMELVLFASLRGNGTCGSVFRSSGRTAHELGVLVGWMERQAAEVREQVMELIASRAHGTDLKDFRDGRYLGRTGEPGRSLTSGVISSKRPA